MKLYHAYIIQTLTKTESQKKTRNRQITLCDRDKKKLYKNKTKQKTTV